MCSQRKRKEEGTEFHIPMFLLKAINNGSPTFRGEGEKKVVEPGHGERVGREDVLSMEAGDRGEWRHEGESPSRMWPPDQSKSIYFILFILLFICKAGF